MSDDAVREVARKHMAEMNMPVGSDHPALIALGAPDLRGLGSVGDLRTAAEYIEGDNPFDGDDHRQEGRARAWDDGFERGKEAVLEIPALRQAWERSQAIDAEPFAGPEVNDYDGGRADGHNALLSRLRAFGPVQEGPQ